MSSYDIGEEDIKEEEEVDTSDWESRIVYEPWAFSGDLPEPHDVLRRRPDLADDPRWAIYLIGPNDGDIEVDETGLTLKETGFTLEEDT